MRVRKSQLGPMTFIAQGAVGQVFRLDAAKIPGVKQRGPVAYKEIKAELQGSARDQAVHSMERAVALRDAMDSADRADLDLFTTWPFAVVEDQGATVGTLMPLIPSEFFVTVTAGGNPKQEVFAYAFLSAAESYVRAMGIDRSLGDDPLVRMSLAAQLAYAIGLLHKHDIVYGDLSLQNVAIALSNKPNLLLLDCDAAAAVTDDKRHQLHSPGFKPPENLSGAQQKQDLKTDIYKLGLCILRGLVAGRGVTQLTDPGKLAGVLDGEGVRLITRALSVDRDARPTAKELCLYFEKLVVSKAQPPVIHEARLNRRAMARGQDVVVRWRAEGAGALRIQGLNGLSVQVQEPDGHPHGYAVTPTASGPIHVEVENRHGTVSVEAGYVDLYELPRFELEQATLPRPVIPALTPVILPAALSKLPTLPYVTVAAEPAHKLADAARHATDALTHAIRETSQQSVTLTGARAFAETAKSTHLASQQAIEQVMSGVYAELRRRIAADPPNLSPAGSAPTSSAQSGPTP